MIIWLASYPKSGNTWLRSIISALLYSKNGDFNFELLKKIRQFTEKKFFKDIISDFSNFDEIKRNWITAQEKINLSKNVRIFKTHQGKYTLGDHDFTNNKNTLAVIYIVRDPRNLVKSLSHHFDLTLDEACEFLLLPKMIGNGERWSERKDGMYNLLGKWNDHYRSWTTKKDHLLLIRYEDLEKDIEFQVNRIIAFLKKYTEFKTNINKNNKIIETTSFGNLQNMERENKFIENAFSPEKKKINFFHLGPKNQWRNNLNKKIIEKIENNFSKEMEELNYL